MAGQRLRDWIGGPTQEDEMTPKHADEPTAQPGDRLEVSGLPGLPPRRGEVLEVLGSPGHVHYRVRWDERHESLFFPADGAAHVINRREGKRAT